MSSTALATFDSTFGAIKARSAQLQRILPPNAMIIERFLGLCSLALARNSDLLRCSQPSILDSVFRAAQLGLDPSGALGSAYLVPFKGECVFVPGYRGLIDLMVRTGEVKGVKSVLVYWGDEFDMEEGDKPRLFHKPWYPKTLDEQRQTLAVDREVRGAYAVAKLPSRETQFKWMDFKALEAIRKRAPGGNSQKTPWFTDRPEMYAKCPVRAISKQIAINPVKAGLLAMAESFDDQADTKRKEVSPGEFEWTDEKVAFEVSDEPVVTSKGGAEKLKAMMRGKPPTDAEVAGPDTVPEPPAEVK